MTPAKDPNSKIGPKIGPTIGTKNTVTFLGYILYRALFRAALFSTAGCPILKCGSDTAFFRVFSGIQGPVLLSIVQRLACSLLPITASKRHIQGPEFR